MKNVKFIPVYMPNCKHGYKYRCIKTVRYRSARYNKCVTVYCGFYSDGATWAPDINSDCWWFHDVLCVKCTFDDGTPCTNWQASCVLYDIMRSEGRNYLRANRWRWGTFLIGGQKIKKQNGWLIIK